ncbi:3531_t:CDS:1, partial [Funneliformis geosporum]
SIDNYENWDKNYDDDDEQEKRMEMSTLVTIGQQLLNNNTNIPSTCKDQTMATEMMNRNITML